VPRVIEPTLIRAGGLISVNNAGATAELDFDFGNLEGALLLGVQYGVAFGSSLTGLVEIGMNFTGTAAAPSGTDLLRVDENVFADDIIQVLGVSAVGFQIYSPRYQDLESRNMIISSNIALQARNTAAVARTISVKVYYKRVLFSQNELLFQLAVRR